MVYLTGQTDREQAHALYEAGYAHAMRLDCPPATDTLELAVEALRAFGDEEIPLLLKAYGFLTACYQHERRFEEATTALRYAISEHRRLPTTDTTQWIGALHRLALSSIELNDYRLATDAVSEAVRLRDELNDPESFYHRVILQTAAHVYQVFGDLDLAETYARRLLRDNEPNRYGASIFGHVILGQALLRRGNAEEAEKVFRAGMALDTARTGRYDGTVSFVLHQSLARLAANRGNYREAFALIEHGRRRGKREDIRTDAVAALNRGTVFGTMGEADSALAAYDQAMAIISEGRPTVRVDGIPYVENDSTLLRHRQPLRRIYQHRGKMLEELGRTDAAIRDYRHLTRLMNDLRGEVTSDDSRYALSEELHDVHSRLIRLLHLRAVARNDENAAWEALEVSENARAYTLLHNASTARHQRTSRERDLLFRIAALERQGPTNKSALSDLRLELDLLRTSAPAADSVPQIPLSADRLATLLPGHATRLLEYHVSDDATYRFDFSRATGLSITRIELGKDSLNQLVRGFRAAIEASAYQGKSLRAAEEQARLDEDFLRYGRALARLLLPALPDSTGLVVVPSDVLEHLPFAALPLTDAALPLDYGGLNYLGGSAELRLAFSATRLLQLRTRDQPEFAANWLGIAPEYEGSAGPAAVGKFRSARIGRMKPGTALPALSSLRYNQKEVERVHKILGRGVTLTGAQATKNAFLQRAGGAQLIHIAGHGLTDAQHPVLSFLAFSQLGRDSITPEELLYFNDLSTLPLNSDLVVLSACETSLGKLTAGENSLSLNSAFAAAGARSTLTSLWKIDDEATQELMVSFYRYLHAGQSREAALAAATRSVSREPRFQHPAYWSGLVLTGEGGPIALARVRGGGQGRMLGWIGIGALGAGLLLLIRQRRSAKEVAHQ